MLWFKCQEIIPGMVLGILYVACSLSGVFWYMEYEQIEDVDNHCRIAYTAGRQMDNFRRKNYSAFVVGFSGEVGRHLLEALNEAKIFKKITLIGRRTINLDHLGPEFVQHQVKFDLLEDYEEVFEGIDFGFCTLGTSHGSVLSADFNRVDHDYVLKTAELAKYNGCKHFSVISSHGADSNSSFFFNRIKGQMEETLIKMKFNRLSIFRPGVLLCNRPEHRPGDTIFQSLLRPVAYFFPTAVTLPVETAALAMLNNVIGFSNRTVDIYENKAIHVVAGLASQYCPPELVPIKQPPQNPKYKDHDSEF